MTQRDLVLKMQSQRSCAGIDCRGSDVVPECPFRNVQHSATLGSIAYDGEFREPHKAMAYIVTYLDATLTNPATTVYSCSTVSGTESITSRRKRLLRM
jgi:hypothetical protein